ncbi:carboxymuconolactone decarboxylase family protein [Kitasatospora sp. NPDC058965]|uniref:carboxymuconolactone decarboxylase family protein n=1 Tax=Kitasatospora sp. NPDC058965 TaxID=3346682 RepID=UPI0036A3115B
MTVEDSLSRATVDRAAGYRTLDEYQDRATQLAALPALERIAPGFPDWIVTSLFGGTYQRPGLTPPERQLVTIATLATLGGVDPQLTGHIRSALRVGLTRQQVVEVLVHQAPYIGAPKALAALRVAAAAFEALDAEGAAQ